MCQCIMNKHNCKGTEVYFFYSDSGSKVPGVCCSSCGYFIKWISKNQWKNIHNTEQIISTEYRKQLMANFRNNQRE